MNIKKNTAHQDLWDATKIVIREEVVNNMLIKKKDLRSIT